MIYFRVMLSSTKPLIGGHVSAASGVYNAIANGEAIGAACIQIFGSSPRQWAVRVPPSADVAKFREFQAKSTIQKVFLHAPYLANIASPRASLRKISTVLLIKHLQITESLGAVGLIFHIGSGQEMPKKQAMAEAVKCMKEIIKGVPGQSYLIIENAAGGGQKLGALSADIGTMMQAVKSPRIRACIDTAHAFEAGVIMEYTPANVKRFADELDRTIGLENIVALHANDSMTAAGSHHDRHENIGKGYIGFSGFKNLAKEKRFWDKAWLLEVPGFTGEGPDKKNVQILNSCFS